MQMAIKMERLVKTCNALVLAVAIASHFQSHLSGQPGSSLFVEATASFVSTTHLLQSPTSSNARLGESQHDFFQQQSFRSVGAPFQPLKRPIIRRSTIMASTVSSTISKDVALAAAATSKIIVKYKSNFLSLFFAFLMGGVFFSAAAAAAASVYGFGLENTRRVLRIARIFIRRIMESVGISLVASRDVLMGRERSLTGLKGRFKAAWKTLMDGFAEARRTAVEGVEAVKLEASLFAAAVGLPGLIPLQYALDRMMPLTLTGPITGALRDSLAQATAGANAKSLPNIQKLTLRDFKTGDVAPTLLEARLYDIGPEDLAFDFEVRWDSNLVANIDMTTKRLRAKIPVSVRNLRFEGPVRLIVTKLTSKEPGWTAMLLSLPEPPKIGLDVRVMGGEFTRVPWIRTEITKAINEAIKKEVLWPERVVVSSPVPGKFKPSLSPAEIAVLEKDDPLLRAQKKLNETLPTDFKLDKAGFKKPVNKFEMAVIDGVKVSSEEEESKQDDEKYVWYKPWKSSFSTQKKAKSSPVKKG